MNDSNKEPMNPYLVGIMTAILVFIMGMIGMVLSGSYAAILGWFFILGIVPIMIWMPVTLAGDRSGVAYIVAIGIILMLSILVPY